MLFEDKERACQESIHYSESNWNYLDRSGRIEAQRVRDLLNCCISNYPESERNELISRIKCGDENHFNSATTELIIFSILRSLDCSIEIHPEIENGKETKPDFLVTTSEGDSVYVEVVLTSEFSKNYKSAQKRKDIVLDKISEIDSPNFFINILDNNQPNTCPKGKELQNKLKEWIDQLDKSKVLIEFEEKGIHGLPTMKWEHDGWSVKFQAMPKESSKSRIIGLRTSGFRLVNIKEPIKKVISKKSNHYGKLEHPLLIVVNAIDTSLHEIDERDVLFGDECLEYACTSPSESWTHRSTRTPNGVWKVGKNTRVSGVWFFNNLNSWNISTRKNTLYFNPWGEKQLPQLFTALNHVIGNNGKLEKKEGALISDLLNLPVDWPEQDEEYIENKSHSPS